MLGPWHQLLLTFGMKHMDDETIPPRLAFWVFFIYIMEELSVNSVVTYLGMFEQVKISVIALLGDHDVQLLNENNTDMHFLYQNKSL